jgi:hypothetical protein
MTAATATGGALAQAFSGFIVTFNASGNPNYIPDLPTINAFMQVAISNSSGDQARYLSQTGDLITYTYTLPEDRLLAYTTTTGHPTALSYNLNEYLDDLIANDARLPSQATNLSLWNLDSMYIGEETNDRTANNENAGQVNVGLQISNINLQTDYSLTSSYENPSTFETNASTSSAPSSPAPTPPILFTMTDTTQSNTTIPITADSYSGPLSFLSHSSAFSYNGSDNVQVTAVNAINPLIATGSGVDLLTGSSTGTSVLDAGTNANIETDGGNGNTAFIQNGYVAGTTWDFIQSFHGADEDIIFGYIPGLSKIAVQALGGLGSDMGATVTIHPGNGNIEEATFVGIGLSALHGTSAMIDGVPSWVLWT